MTPAPRTWPAETSPRVPDRTLARYPGATQPPGGHTTAELATLLRQLHAIKADAIAIGHGRHPASVTAARALAAAWTACGHTVAVIADWPAAAASWLRPARRLTSGQPDAWVIADTPAGCAQLAGRLVGQPGWTPTRTFGFASLAGPDLIPLSEMVLSGTALSGMSGATADGGSWRVEGQLMILAASGTVTGEDGLARPPWASADALLRDYYDHEWGLAVRDERGLFERISLECFQSGLSWAVILRKRPAFRAAFGDFDPDTVARYGPSAVDRLLGDPGIVRHRRKIEATIANARATADLRADGGLAELVWSFRPAVTPAPVTIAEIPTRSAESTALAAALRRRGFTFVGPTSMFAFMEAVGIVDTHLVGSHRRGSSGVWPAVDHDAQGRQKALFPDYFHNALIHNKNQGISW